MNNHKIQALKQEAAEAGDDMMEVICIIAFEGPIDSYESRFGGGCYRLTRAQQEQLESMSQADAQALVLKAMQEACNAAESGE